MKDLTKIQVEGLIKREIKITINIRKLTSSIKRLFTVKQKMK